MQSLRETIKNGGEKKVALGHFNISDSVALQAIFDAARELGLPVIIGASEGERSFLGTTQVAAMVEGLRKAYDYPIYLNADHTHSLESAVAAARAGYDAVLFDAGKLAWGDNLAKTAEVVKAIREINPEIIVEGEIGYIGGSSKVLEAVPEGAAVKPEDLTTPQQAREFVETTGVDLLAPAVGNLHGMFKNAANPRLDIGRIRAIGESAGVPLVLHGGSGIVDDDFRSAISVGIRIVHINTEIRLAWRRGMESGLAGDKNEVAPYKIAESALADIKEVVLSRLRLFGGI
ncbi:MAG TPA: class II fructose-bisphosphate aldolase [Candidatus Paceibacterota bacterium]